MSLPYVSTVQLVHCGNQQLSYLDLLMQVLLPLAADRLGRGPDLPPLTELPLPPRLPLPPPLLASLLLMPLAGPRRKAEGRCIPAAGAARLGRQGLPHRRFSVSQHRAAVGKKHPGAVVGQRTAAGLFLSTLIRDLKSSFDDLHTADERNSPPTPGSPPPPPWPALSSGRHPLSSSLRSQEN